MYYCIQLLDNMTEDDVAPYLEKLSSNYSSVESSIGNAQILQNKVNTIQDGFIEVS